MRSSKKAPEAGQGFEGDVSSQSSRKGNRAVTIIPARRSDVRIPLVRARRLAWTLIAAGTALVVVIAANPLVTDLALWVAAVVLARLAVVDRRRARRAAHRAASRADVAILEAIAVANGHATVSREVAA